MHAHLLVEVTGTTHFIGKNQILGFFRMSQIFDYDLIVI